MLIQIGKRAPTEGVVDNLLECHARIRHFTDLASRLASAADLTEDDVRKTAEAVDRYFRDSLPLHARDEEESILPRLIGLDPLLDEALKTMAREHDEHEPVVEALLENTRAIARDPGTWASRKQPLSLLCRTLEDHFDEHLRAEEELIFPALQSFLAEADRKAIADEMRERRSVP